MTDCALTVLSGDGEHFLFGIALRRIAALTALGGIDERYDQHLLARQINWLTNLVNARDELRTYDLRIISAPHPGNYLRGRIEIALLCRIERAAEDEARRHALELLRLVESYFDDEYEFELVSRTEDLKSLLQPFPIGATVQVTRRTEMAALDTLRGGWRRLPPGFMQQAVLPPDQSSMSVYHVFPYILTPGSASTLFKLMLMHDEPLALSFRLRPTYLTNAETQFFDRQIARCERYAQVSVSSGGGEDLGSIHPTLQEQARTFRDLFIQSLGVLKDNAAVMRVELAAPHRVPQTVVDMLGAELTQPAGGLGAAEGLKPYLSGGYEFEYLSGESLARAAEAFANLELLLEPDGIAPAEAVRLRYLFDPRESAAAFRFPAPPLQEMPGISVKTSRTQMAPAAVPDCGHLIGHSVHNGRLQPVRLSRDDRRRHLYAVGQTGTGKTTMFESMIMADIGAGAGLCVIDPHGDLIEKLLGKIPKERAEDVVLFDPCDMERPVGFNMLEYETEAQKFFLVQEIIGIIERLLEQWDPAMGGPMFYQHTRMGLLLVMSNPEEMGTLVQFYQIFNSREFYKRFLPLRSSDPVLENFVNEVLARTDYLRTGSEGTSFGSYISSKFEGFVTDPMLRNIFGQQRSTINLREIMDTGQILLVNLSKGRLGEINSRFLGMVMIAKLQAAAMARAAQPIEQRRDFYLYVDEFQNLATPNFGVLLSEARKYRLNLILTNQYVSQVDAKITSAIAGNVGTTISFRVGPVDAELLEREFLSSFNRYDLMNLPNFHTCVSTLIDGQVSKPFSMRTILDESPVDEKLGSAVRELSGLKYGKPRGEVETEIAESLAEAT